MSPAVALGSGVSGKKGAAAPGDAKRGMAGEPSRRRIDAMIDRGTTPVGATVCEVCDDRAAVDAQPRTPNPAALFETRSPCCQRRAPPLERVAP